MTNEELLQQAKDQVAKEELCDTWRGLLSVSRRLASNEDAANYVDRCLFRAALLAIQSAREEGGKPGRYKLWHPEFQEWIYWGFIDGMYVGPPTGRGLTLDYIQEHSKLTAPGR